MDTNEHEETKIQGHPSTTSGTKMHLQSCALGVTMSWDDGFLGARASRPHQAWHSLGCLPHLDQPETAPWLSFGLADAVTRPQGGCLQHRTEAQRRPKGQDAGGTPALPGDAVPAVRWGVSGGRLLRMPTCTLWKTPVCPRAGPPPCRADHSRVKQRTSMAYREQGPHAVKPVCCTSEHR